MFTSEDLHQYSKLFQQAMGRLERSNLTEEEKRLVKQFCDEKLANGVTKARAITYVNNFIRIRKFLAMPLTNVSKDDLVSLFKQLETRHYADYTKSDMKRTVKRFFQWMAGMTGSEYPDTVKWIAVASKRTYKQLGEIPTLEELLRIQSAITNYRDKALFWVALETGARPEAVLSPQLKDLKIERDYVRIATRDKKGERYIWVIVSRRFLLQWLENHPLKHDPEAPLWVNLEGSTKMKMLRWSTFKNLIQKHAASVGVKKRIYPYLMRHRDASWKSDWMTEQQLAQDKGWVQGSDMPRVYVHRNSNRHRDMLLKHFGIETPPDPEDLKIKRCPRCGEKNPPVANYCLRCGWNLDEQIVEHKDSGIAHTEPI